MKLGTRQPWIIDPEMKKDLDVAKALFEQKKYAEAEPLFHKIYQLDKYFSWTAPFAIFTEDYTGLLGTSEVLDSDETKAKKKDWRDKNSQAAWGRVRSARRRFITRRNASACRRTIARRN